MMPDQQLHSLTIESITQRNEEESPIVILVDDHGSTLEIAIGLCEARAIQMGLEREALQSSITRPMTHDLLLQIAEELHAQPASVIIDDFSGGIYFARIIFDTLQGEMSLDCRPSDGIAVAVRAEIPLFASDAVMNGEDSGTPE